MNNLFSFDADYDYNSIINAYIDDNNVYINYETSNNDIYMNYNDEERVIEEDESDLECEYEKNTVPIYSLAEDQILDSLNVIVKRKLTNNISSGMFTDDIFDAFVIKLEQLVIDLNLAHICEYLDNIACEAETCTESEPAISTIANNQFGSFKHNIHINFADLDNICSSYVFTSKVHNEMSLKKQ
ncbi:11868_t:CDS:2 [Scutellospora calospora]|uniref:11868_t:CDS:1 n=1 Tax=Scutellospora calospora TaxID=85575 RepID=A0ACA9KHX5_9GLOM|nr:11868_t:CDS:2 [Scutellospora calospora]